MKDFIWSLVGSMVLICLSFTIYTLGTVHGMLPQ